MNPRDWTPTDAADAADAEHDRQWWKRPDPHDPRNRSAEPETIRHGYAESPEACIAQIEEYDD